MTRLFGHGGLRLVLLSLLEDGPRHGYELIVALEDRFMGMYRPSAGTIYPRLGALEEEGLVASEEIDGKRVYRLTEAGREELARRRAEVQATVDSATSTVRAVMEDLQQEVRAAVDAVRQHAASPEARQAVDDARRVAVAEAKRVRRMADDLRRQAGSDAATAGFQAREGARQAAREAAAEAERIRRDVAAAAAGLRTQAKETAARARQTSDLTVVAARGAAEAATGAGTIAADAARRASAAAVDAARTVAESAGEVRPDIEALVADVAAWAADAVREVRLHLPDEAGRQRIASALADARRAFVDALRDDRAPGDHPAE